MQVYPSLRSTQNHLANLVVSIQDCVLDVKYHKPDIVNNHAHHSTMEEKEPCAVPSTPGRTIMRRSSSVVANSQYMELSPTGRSTIPIGDPSVMTWTHKGDDGYGFRQRNGMGRHHDSRASNQNYVDIERIRCGVDVRTTVSIFLSTILNFDMALT